MNTTKNKNVFEALLLSLAITFYILLMWEVTVSLIFHLQKYLPLNNLNSSWWQILMLIGYGLVLGFSGGKIQYQTNAEFYRSLYIFLGNCKFYCR